MKIVIIEDERLTAADLKETILQIDSSIEVIAILKSVSEASLWFKENTHPDLIFSDIKLGDGLSFEVFGELNIPVIFCTAYDEFALNAFRANGIDYILKPFTTRSVEDALTKFRTLTGYTQEAITEQYDVLRQLFAESKGKATSLLIHQKDIIMPVRVEDIALFQLRHDMISLVTFSQKVYYPGKSLDELEHLCGGDFFRVNRQFLVNRKAIAHASSLLSRKLSIGLTINHKDVITISREKAPSFLRWLSGE